MALPQISLPDDQLLKDDKKDVPLPQDDLRMVCDPENADDHHLGAADDPRMKDADGTHDDPLVRKIPHAVREKRA